MNEESLISIDANCIHILILLSLLLWGHGGQESSCILSWVCLHSAVGGWWWDAILWLIVIQAMIITTPGSGNKVTLVDWNISKCKSILYIPNISNHLVMCWAFSFYEISQQCTDLTSWNSLKCKLAFMDTCSSKSWLFTPACQLSACLHE